MYLWFHIGSGLNDCQVPSLYDVKPGNLISKARVAALTHQQRYLAYHREVHWNCLYLPQQLFRNYCLLPTIYSNLGYNTWNVSNTYDMYCMILGIQLEPLVDYFHPFKETYLDRKGLR